MAIATGSPSGSVTPTTDTFTNCPFGGQSVAGPAVAALQSSGRFPGAVVVVVGGAEVVDVVLVGGRVVVVEVLVVVGGAVVVVVAVG